MFQYTFLILSLIVVNYLSLIETLLASNIEVVTGFFPYICALFRPKDYVIDDLPMPAILTFCSCTIIHHKWALTARLCFVQRDWYISPINSTFSENLPKNLHTIKEIIDVEEITLIQFTPYYTGPVANISKDILKETTTCYLYGFSPPDNEPISGSVDHMIYKVWHMEGDLLRAKVIGLEHKECENRYNNYLSEYKNKIDLTVLCLNPVDEEYLEPCTFDRGAPILCNGSLQGVLVYDRPLPPSLPLHLPTGCYGNINTSYAIYAESITNFNHYWINLIIQYNSN